MIKPQLFLRAEWELVILHSAARNALRFAVCSAWSESTLMLRALKSRTMLDVLCNVIVWFFIRKFLSSYWSMFRNTSCSYGNHWEFCPWLQTEQEQTPCLQHQTRSIKWQNWVGLLSFTSVKRSAYKSGDSKGEACRLLLGRLHMQRQGLPLPYPQRTSQICTLASNLHSQSGRPVNCCA